MAKVEVDTEYLSNLRALAIGIECSDEEVVKQLDGSNIEYIMAAIAKSNDEVHPIDRITKFEQVPELVGVVTDEQYESISVAMSVLYDRRNKYLKAINAIDAWSGSHEQGEVWNVLQNRLATTIVCLNTLRSILHERATPDYCRSHPEECANTNETMKSLRLHWDKEAAGVA